MATAYLIHGYLGAGKTTFAKKLENEVNGIRFTHDEWMAKLFGNDPDPLKFPEYYNAISGMIYSLWPRCLELGNNVILDLNFWSRKQRDETRNIILNLNADFQLYYLKCSNETAWERVSKRNSKVEANLHIEPNTFNILQNQFEPLDSDENHILIET